MKCDFCDDIVLRKQLVFRDKLASIIYPRKPVVFGHIMIIPNRHVATFEKIKDNEVVNMSQLTKKAYKAFKKERNACGFNLIVNDGIKAGQHVPHVHWHILFRFEKEPISPLKILGDASLREKLSRKEWEKRKEHVARWVSR